MPATTPNGVSRSREPQRALLTPSASPSLPPPDRPPTKRPRLRSTPSSSVSATPSASNDSTSSVEVDSARRASTLRVLNVWAQLAERYNKRLDEDDIVDLYSGAIIKDRGVVKGATRDYHIGHFAQPDDDQDYPDADQDQDDSEQDDDDNELLPLSETTTDDDAPISKKELLRGVPPLSSTTDAEDLREFLEAERNRRELAGDEEDEDDISPERLSTIRKALEEQSQNVEATTAGQVQGATSAEHPQQDGVDATPRGPSARTPLADDESEDELALWTHDESTSVYPLARDASERNVHDVEREVIELSESDSDEEFEAILTRPPRFSRVSPLPVSRPPPKQVEQTLQSPPDSERGRSQSRASSRSKIKLKDELTPKSENRPCTPVVHLRKPEVNLTHRKKLSAPKLTGTMASYDDGIDQEVNGRVSPARKGKAKETSTPVNDSHREKTSKSLGTASRGRKRKRIASSTNGSPSTKSIAEPKNSPRSHGKPASQRSTVFLQSDGPEPTPDKDTPTPARFESAIPGPSHFFPTRSSVSTSQHSILSIPPYRSPAPEPVQPMPRYYDSIKASLSSSPTIAHTHLQRHPSLPSSILSSPNQGTPGPSLTGGHLPPPPPSIDPVQTQQAHYLLAQAMQQLSYVLSTMSPYPAYTSSHPSQPWHQPPPPPHAAYSTPVHSSHFHGTRPYHTPSSSISRSVLTPSSPVRSTVSPPLEECRARSRGRSKSRGRRVSFKLESEEATRSREHNDEHHNGPKKYKQILEGKRDGGQEKATEEFDDTFRLEDRGNPPKEVARGRTPGPPGRKKIDVPRGRSLSRR